MQQHQRRCRCRRRWHYTAQQKIRWTVFVFGGVRCIIACCWWLTYEYVWVSGSYNLYTSFVGSSAVGCCTYVYEFSIWEMTNRKTARCTRMFVYSNNNNDIERTGERRREGMTGTQIECVVARHPLPLPLQCALHAASNGCTILWLSLLLLLL